MRVGIVTTSYPRFAGDAAGTFVAGHAAYLRATGAEVEVIAAGDADDDHAAARDDRDARDARDARDHDDRERDAGLRVIRVAAPRGLFYRGGAPDTIEAGGASPIALARFSAALALAVRRRAPAWDAACAHWWVPCAAAAALSVRAPLLAIAHGGDLHVARRARVLAPVAALLVARRARLAFVSTALRDAALAALPAPLARRAAAAALVQPMAIDVAALARLAAARAPRAPAAPATLVVLARLVPIKGVAIAIAAMRHLRAPARLVVAGDGPLRAELEAAAAAARADGHDVALVGALAAADRDALLARADALIAPSIATPGGRVEGMPLAALEAMAAGVRVVASATGGLAELPADAAALAPPGDARALAAAIDRALAAPPPAAAARHVAALDWAHVGAALDAHWGRADAAGTARRPR